MTYQGIDWESSSENLNYFAHSKLDWSPSVVLVKIDGIQVTDLFQGYDRSFDRIQVTNHGLVSAVDRDNRCVVFLPDRASKVPVDGTITGPIAFSNDEKFILTASNDGLILSSTLDITTKGKLPIIWTREFKFSPATALCWWPDNKNIVIGDRAGKVYLLNAVSGDIIKSIGEGTPIRRIEMVKSGNYFLLQRKDCAELWNANSFTLVCSTPLRLGALQSTLLDPEERFFGCLSSDSKVRFFECESGKELYTLDSAPNSNGIAISPDGTLIAVSESTLVNNFSVSAQNVKIWHNSHCQNSTF